MENNDPFGKFFLVEAKNGGKYLVYNGYTYTLNKKNAVSMTPNYESVKKIPTDLHSDPPPMNTEKENTRKIFVKNLKSRHK